MSARGRAPTQARSTVRLLLACNKRCAFCAQDGLVGLDPPLFEADLERARALSDELTFTGGEPTLDDALASKVSAARAIGFRRVGVQTNGSRLASASYTRALRDAGLTDVHLSVHGADAAVHDYHSGRPGSFGDLLAALHNARTSDLVIAVTTVLTRSNFRVLAGIPKLLERRGASAWFVSVPVIAGRAAALRDRIVPRLGLAIPFALHALAAADAVKLPSWTVGAPACLLGPFATRALASETRAYAAVCETCPAQPSCPGVDPDYLARWGGDELAPRDAVASAKTSDLAAMFVGAGETAPREAPAVAAVASARRSLPMLGKVRPAIAEASAGKERRTGEALREILPALFGDEEKR